MKSARFFHQLKKCAQRALNFFPSPKIKINAQFSPMPTIAPQNERQDDWPENGPQSIVTSKKIGKIAISENIHKLGQKWVENKQKCIKTLQLCLKL